jgi:hypothetical protein
MTSNYTITTQEPATPTTPARAGLRTAGAWCLVGGVIGVVGAGMSAVIPTSVSPARLSYPFTPGVFQLTEVLWTITHVLTLIGVIALARSGLVGSARLARLGLPITLVGMALLVPTELGFAFIADAAEDSTASMVSGTAIGLAATVAGVGFVLAGVATLRRGSWTGWGRWTPLACGLWVILVLLPVQGLWPSLFLWTIAGWSVCLSILSSALIGEGSKIQASRSL